MMQNLQIQTQDGVETVNILRARLRLPGEGKLIINGDFSIASSDELKRVAATVVPHLKENEQRISLDIISAEGQGLNHELINAILQQISDLLDLRNFDIPGISMELREFDVQVGQIILYANSTIEQVPSV